MTAARQVFAGEVEIGFIREAIEEDGDDLELTVTGDVRVFRGSGSYHAPSDLDYHGYCEIEDIRAVDFEGRAVSLTAAEEEDIEERLIEAVQDEV